MSWRIFDELDARYDSWYERNALIYENELSAVEALGLNGIGAEIGVGTGRFAAPLGIPLGMDASERMLRSALSRGVDAVRGMAEDLPLRSSSMDYVLFVVTLCFLEDPLAALREARRVLRKDGTVAACIVPRDSSWGAYYTSRGGRFYSSAKFYTTDELSSMLRSAGLSPVRVTSTLSRGPLDPPAKELPGADPRAGFVCISSRVS
ncbi:MAG: class I SAM-dependent methyltransferase [Conexivisphaera sp.]|jgi:SAM-dependent methyltransferase